MVRLQQSGEVDRGGLAFDRGIRGDDHFLHPSSFDTLQQLFRTNVRRTDTVQRGQHPEQHVIQPTVSPCALDRV